MGRKNWDGTRKRSTNGWWYEWWRGWYGGNWPVCTLFPRRIPHKYKGCLVLVTGCRGVGKKRRDRERERGREKEGRKARTRGIGNGISGKE